MSSSCSCRALVLGVVLAVALVALVVVLVVKPLVSLRCFVLLGAVLGILFSPRCFTFIILARF